MTTTAAPTNEEIVRLLTEILRELGKVQKDQRKLAADVARVSESLRR